MEVVPRAREIGRDVLVRLARRDVVEAPPLEQQPAGRDVDLLDHALLDRVAFSRAPEERQVVRDLLEDGEQGGVAWREQELVQVARAAVRGVDLCDGAVAVVGDDVVAVSAGCRLSAPPRQDGMSAVALDREVGDAVGVERAEPHRLAVVLHDHRTGLLDDLLRAEEQVAGSGAAGAGQDVHRGWTQVGPRVEVLRRIGRAVPGRGRRLPAAGERESGC